MATRIETLLHLPASRPAPAGTLPVRIADTLLGWLDRARSRRLLAGLDDRMLRDIGVSQGSALNEADKPFWRG